MSWANEGFGSELYVLYMYEYPWLAVISPVAPHLFPSWGKPCAEYTVYTHHTLPQSQSSDRSYHPPPPTPTAPSQTSVLLFAIVAHRDFLKGTVHMCYCKTFFTFLRGGFIVYVYTAGTATGQIHVPSFKIKSWRLLRNCASSTAPNQIKNRQAELATAQLLLKPLFYCKKSFINTDSGVFLGAL